MDLKTRLEEDSLFGRRKDINEITKDLNAKGIYTVEDFINCDIDKTYKTGVARKRNRAFQSILKYNYLGVPLSYDVLLEKEYRSDDWSVVQTAYKDFICLGFTSGYRISMAMKSEIKEKGSCKVIDVILNYDIGKDYLKNFYTEYYNNLKNKNIEEPINNKDNLESLKNELTNLIKRRNELDSKISSLLEQVNALEGEQNVNGRK